MRNSSYLSKTALQRVLLEKRLIDSNNCWIWTGGKEASGYGQMRYLGDTRRVNRLAMLAFKDIPLYDKRYALHKPECKSRTCFNPEHLYMGTQRQNMSDRSNSVTHCIYGHEYTPENTYYQQKGRCCKICAKARSMSSYNKRKTS